MSDLLGGSAFQLAAFLAAAVIAGALSVRLRQPSVILLIIAGALIGPHMLGIVTDSSLVELFSTVGAVFLLFAIGLEFSISKLISSGFRAAVVTFFKMGTIFFFGYQAGMLLGAGILGSLALGIMFSITSTSIMVKILEQKRMLKRQEFPFLFSALVIEDVVAVAALTFLSSLSSGASPTIEGTAFSIFFAIAVLVITYRVLRILLTRYAGQLMRYQTNDTKIFLALSLCTALALFASVLGLQPAIGAFMAGMVISALPNSRPIEYSVKPFILSFSSLFFLAVGTMLDPAIIISQIWVLLPLSLFFVLVMFFTVCFYNYMAGFNSASAVFAGSSMVVVGEFSLLIATTMSGFGHGLNLLGLVSLSILISTICASFLLDNQKRIDAAIKRRLPYRAKHTLTKFSDYFKLVIADFELGGAFSKMLFARVRTMVNDLVRFAVVAFCFLVLYWLFGSRTISVDSHRIRISLLILLASLPFVFFPIYRILLNLAAILDALARSITHVGNEESDYGRKLVRNVLASTFLIFAALDVPIFVAIFQLPSVFNLLNIPLILLALLFIWSILGNVPGHIRRFRDGGRKAAEKQ
jgi:CPA2 family monovalent cation:H+ antiporter-2